MMRRLPAFLVLALLWCTPLQAAIAQDAVAGTSTGAAGTTLSWSHTSAASAVMIVTVGYQGSSTTVGVTYNGVSMTQLWNKRDDVGVQGSAGFAMSAPASGAHTVAVTFGASVDLSAGGSVTYTGVVTTNDSLMHRTVYTANEADTPGTTATVTVVDSQSGDLVINGVIMFTGTGIVSGQTSIIEADPIGGGSSAYGMATSTAVGASTANTWTSASSFWAIGATALVPAGGGGGVVCGARALTGVGCDAQ